MYELADQPEHKIGWFSVPQKKVTCPIGGPPIGGIIGGIIPGGKGGIFGGLWTIGGMPMGGKGGGIPGGPILREKHGYFQH